MNQTYLVVTAAIAGIVCGIASNHGFLQGQWLNLVLWGFVGAILGLFVNSRNSMLKTGTIFGIFLVLSFLYSGFQGTASVIPSFILLSIVLALLGALCGIVCAYVGFEGRKYLLK